MQQFTPDGLTIKFISREHEIIGIAMIETRPNQSSRHVTPTSSSVARYNTSLLENHRRCSHVVQTKKVHHITKEMYRQSLIVAKATELRLEVEVRRTYTTLQCELLGGESSKERNAIYKTEEFIMAMEQYSSQSCIDWFDLAQKILTKNDIAAKLGFHNIGNQKSLADAYTSAIRAAAQVQEHESRLALLGKHIK